MDEARAKRLTLIACILGSAVVFVDQTVVNVALPALRADLNASLADQQWVVEAYLLMLASLILVGGSLGDLYGRRRIFAIGVAGFGAASLVCSIAPSVELLIGARALQGAFGALLVPSSLAIITAVFGPEERAAAIGSWTAGTSSAIALGPPLGGLLVDAISWRVIFAMNVPLVLGCLWLIVRAVPEVPGDGAHRIDVPGALLCVIGLAGPTFALIREPLLGWSDPTVWVPLVGGIGALGAFVAYERRAPDPMMPPAIFRNRNFAVGNVVTLAAYAGLGASSFFIAIFLQQVAGYSAFGAGLSLLPITLLLIALSRRFGTISARVGPRLLMTAGPIVGGLGLLAFTRVGAQGDYVSQVLPATLLFGLGLAMTVAPLTATVLEAADRRHAGIASGVNNAIARVAGLLAIAAVGLVVSACFDATIEHRLGTRATQDGATRAYVDRARERPLAVPGGPVAASTRASVRAADVAAFHRGMVVAGLLMILGGLIAAAGIRNPVRLQAGAD
ncbi:MAG TPA: DHA2 family efflux MFS transporter permease subunit [Solirubrobacteraceae bacterium]|nr:DHA2 family efflux MFS transporter permease subunit [Solirubrobacteraceae bacterium]